MSHIDGFVLAVPTARREDYLKHAAEMAAVMKGYGATGVDECWGDDVPEGKLTSFTMAVKREADESVVLSKTVMGRSSAVWVWLSWSAPLLKPSPSNDVPAM